MPTKLKLRKYLITARRYFGGFDKEISDSERLIYLLTDFFFAE
jgi:hypothetical protein